MQTQVRRQGYGRNKVFILRRGKGNSGSGEAWTGSWEPGTEASWGKGSRSGAESVGGFFTIQLHSKNTPSILKPYILFATCILSLSQLLICRNYF